MRFLYPYLLWLLLLLPLLFAVKGRRGKSPSLLFSTTSMAARLGRKKQASPLRLKQFLRPLLLGLLIIAAARPQLGNTTTEVNASGIDILLAVDVSRSMRALDFTLDNERANRLEVVKHVVDSFIEDRPNDRIGLIAFAKQPYLVCPPTLDHNWLRKRLEALQLGMVDGTQTAIGSAIGSGINRLKDIDSKSRIIILLTDGLNNSGQVPPLLAAEAAETMGVKVYTIGAGSRGEAPMPYSDSYGRKWVQMERVDIDEKTLSEVAEITGALYFRATDTESLTNIYDEINTMETTTRTIKKFEHYKELFPLFVGLAMLMLAFEFIQQRKQLP